MLPAVILIVGCYVVFRVIEILLQESRHKGLSRVLVVPLGILVLILTIWQVLEVWTAATTSG